MPGQREPRSAHAVSHSAARQVARSRVERGDGADLDGRRRSSRGMSPEPSISTRAASSSSRNIPRWPSSARQGLEPRTWTETRAFVRPVPPRRLRKHSAPTARPVPTPTSTRLTPSSTSATTLPRSRPFSDRASVTAAPARTLRSSLSSTPGEPHLDSAAITYLSQS